MQKMIMTMTLIHELGTFVSHYYSIYIIKKKACFLFFAALLHDALLWLKPLYKHFWCMHAIQT